MEDVVFDEVRVFLRKWEGAGPYEVLETVLNSSYTGNISDYEYVKSLYTISIGLAFYRLNDKGLLPCLPRLFGVGDVLEGVSTRGTQRFLCTLGGWNEITNC